MLSELLAVDQRGNPDRCSWLRANLPDVPNTHRSTAISVVASSIVRWQCRGSVVHYERWQDAVDSNSRLDRDHARRLEPFIRPALGLPAKPLHEENLQGFVAEYVWYILAQENLPPECALKSIEGPSFSVTAPGGDGLTVYENSDGSSIFFRLWEIKKHQSRGHISGTVSRAVDQLRAKGDVYLAQLTTTAGDHEGEVGRVYASLPDLWIDRDEGAGAGVAVATSETHLPGRCFGKMHEKFPEFDVSQLAGMVVALGDYPEFARTVRDRVWSAL